ncbi:hypothetical protein CL632_03190, partial [bacterium]|nr:hypothetical protein [bacterium]
MQLSIFPNKKASIAGRKVIFYIYAAIAIAISFLFLVWIVPTSKSEIAIIPPNLENYLVSQRFFSSPECFAFQDEIPDEVHPRMIDLEKFNEDSLNSCYDAINTDVKAYQLTLNYDGIPEIPVPTDFSSPCNDICGDRGCIIGRNNGNNKKCSNSIHFDQSDDYCICGSGSERVIPVPDDITSPCNNICRNIGKGCIIAVDDGKDEECDKPNHRFEGNDDYCICGKDSETVTPVPNDYSDTCNNICTLGNCIMGIDDGNDKKCRNSIDFDQSDDYCICGVGSNLEVPVPRDEPDVKDKSCSTICDDAEKVGCIMGIDDGNKNRACDREFDFEGNDDYCICGPSSEKKIPPKQKQFCDTICKDIGKVCLAGIQNHGDGKSCQDKVEFDNPDDYCICAGDVEKITPVPDDLKDKTCTNICSNIGKGCITGIDDGKDEECDSIDQEFEGDDDYCICGKDSETVTPVPTNIDEYDGDINDDHPISPTNCNTFCGSSLGTSDKCIMGIDNGNNEKICSKPFGFEENDDYCICGTGSEEIFPTSCNVICGTRGRTCVEGINDKDDHKDCAERFGFEDNDPPDDYCKCSGGLDIYPRTCDILCADRGCIAGINNGNDNKKCGDILTIEGDGPIDDYCICGSGS